VNRVGARLVGISPSFAGALTLVRAQQGAPDLILVNGKIVTVDERFSISQAVAIRGDRFVALGTNQEAKQPHHNEECGMGESWELRICSEARK